MVAPIFYGIAIVAAALLASGCSDDKESKEGDDSSKNPSGPPKVAGAPNAAPPVVAAGSGAAPAPAAAPGGAVAPGAVAAGSISDPFTIYGSDKHDPGADFKCCEIDEYCQDDNGNYKSAEGMFLGMTHNSIQAVALLASDMDVDEVERFTTPHGYDAAKDFEAESGHLKGDRKRVTFDTICRTSAGLGVGPWYDWDWTDYSFQRVVGDTAVDVEIDDDFNEDEQRDLLGAFQAVGWNGWDDRVEEDMGFYIGSAFDRMMYHFRDEALKTSNYRSKVVESMKTLELDEAGQPYEGVLQLTYDFAPLGATGAITAQDAEFVRQNIMTLGNKAQEPAFAEVLYAGYFLHRADHNYKLLVSGKEADGTTPLTAERVTVLVQQVTADIDYVFGRVGSPDEVEMSEKGATMKVQLPFTKGAIDMNSLTNHQEQFVRAIQKRGVAIAQGMARFGEPKKPEPAKKAPPKKAPPKKAPPKKTPPPAKKDTGSVGYKDPFE